MRDRSELAEALYRLDHEDGPELSTHPEFVQHAWRENADALLASPVFARLLDQARADALREAAYVFAEGAWLDAFMAADVDDDVSAVRATSEWFRCRADAIGETP